jgi:hypothetical protein
MSRTVPSSLLTALGQPEVELFYAVEFNFDSGPVRFWTGFGEKIIGVDTYVGTGNLLAIDGIDEVSDLSAKSMNLSLSGVPSSLVSLALQEPYQRRTCKVYIGSGGNVIEIFSGLMNTMVIEDSGETSVISLTVESKLIGLERSSNWRYTAESHKQRHSGDSFFDFVAGLQDVSIVWGKESN